MKLCFVTDELLGLFKNGGIGTSTTYLALEAARAGHEIEVLFIQWSKPDLPWSNPKWEKILRENKVKVVNLPELPYDVWPWYAKISIRVYEYLRYRSFDKIIFPDYCAPGWACLNAKTHGQDFLKTDLVQISHSSVGWCNEANSEFIDPCHNSTARDFIVQELEKESYLLADVNVSPSQHMIDWTRSHWGKAKTLHIPYVIGHDDEKYRQAATSSPGHLEEIVFFGRLETRKGIDIFLQALNQADALLCRGLTLTFLGRSSTHDEGMIRNYLRPEILSAFSHVKFLTNYGQDEALQHLKSGRALAIMASPVDNSPCVVYECLGEGIPFLASTGGGIPELVAAEDHGAALFKPTAQGLADLLFPILQSRRLPNVPRAAPTVIAARETWRKFLAEPVMTVKPATTAQPKVSVVIPTFNRPEHLMQLLDNLTHQIYKNFEVIVVDDGSTDPAVAALFARIESMPIKYPLKIVRQENKYLGAARNFGVRQSTGKYVIFVDDDNLLTCEAIGKLVSAIEYSGYDILTTLLKEGWGADLPTFTQMHHGNRWLLLGPLELGVHQNVFGDAMGIYRKTLLEKLPFHELHGVTHEDWDLLARATFAHYKLGRLPEGLFWYRRQTESMIKRTSRYKNMQVITQAYAKLLPPNLQRLPALVNALAEEARVLREACERLNREKAEGNSSTPAPQPDPTIWGLIEKRIHTTWKSIFG